MSRVSQGQSRPSAKTQGSPSPSDPDPLGASAIPDPRRVDPAGWAWGQVLSHSPSPRVTWASAVAPASLGFLCL